MPWHQYCSYHPWIRPLLPVSNGDDFTFCFLSHSKCFGSGVHRGYWGAMLRTAFAGKRKIQVREERRWMTTQSQPRCHQAHVDLLLNFPLKSFLSEASDLGHLVPALTIGCSHFHGEGITLDRAVSLDQQQCLEIQLWATSSHQGSWEDYDPDLGERAGQRATAFTVVTDTRQYHRLSLSPAWPLFSLSLSLVFSNYNLMEIQCSGHMFYFFPASLILFDMFVSSPSHSSQNIFLSSVAAPQAATIFWL